GLEYDNQWTDCRCTLCTEKWEKFQKGYTISVWPWPDDPAAHKLTSEEQLKLICMYGRFRNSEYEEIYELVRDITVPRKPDILIYGNFNTGYNAYTFPKNNAVSTEDGFEPGIVDGKLVQNTGYLRCLSGAGAGWKPVRIEYGRGRGRGQLAKRISESGVGATRFVAMEPIKHQLSMAEAFSHGISFQITPEGEFLRDLYFRTTEAMENWKAISRYNRFFAVHEELYADIETAAGIVSLHNSCFRRISGGGFAQRPALIGELSRRKVNLDIRYDRDINNVSLSTYKVMLLADTCVISGRLREIIKDFSEGGGRIVATGLTGWYDEYFNRYERNALEGISNVHWMQDPSKKILIGLETSKQTNMMEQFPVDADEDLDSQLVDELADTLLSFIPSPL
ncbi:MAG: hypothetical protein Q7J78_04675, partial [Clostridiales bacterium]|nr:hypothetical protein [Clostridiales bacterium]